MRRGVVLALHFCGPVRTYNIVNGGARPPFVPPELHHPHPPPPPAAGGSSITGVWAFLFNMIHFDHVNALQEKGLNYHAINHTIIRVNDLIVTRNPLFPEGINIAAVTFADWGKRK